MFLKSELSEEEAKRLLRLYTTENNAISAIWQVNYICNRLESIVNIIESIRDEHKGD